MVLVPSLAADWFWFYHSAMFCQQETYSCSYAWLNDESFTVFINTRLTPANHNSTFGIIVFSGPLLILSHHSFFVWCVNSAEPDFGNATIKFTSTVRVIVTFKSVIWITKSLINVTLKKAKILKLHFYLRNE